jgi:hypothetical protein
MGPIGWIIVILILVWYVAPWITKYVKPEGYVGDYIMQSGAGYIPLYKLLQPTPNMNRCIDGDSARPCWKDNGQGIQIVRS